MAIKTKAELDADLLTRFPDNTQGLISAQRLREQFADLQNSYLIQRTQVIDMITDPYAIPEAEVTENILHTTSGSDRVVTLPDAAGVDEQGAVILSVDNSLITVQSVSPIVGDSNFTEPVLVVYVSVSGEWLALPTYLSRKDTVEVAIMFNEPGALTAGEEMRLGNTEGQDNQGWVAPFAGKLVKASISRGDSDLADIDIQVNSLTEDTIITNTTKNTYDIDIDVAEGDSVMVLGGATTPNALDHPVVVLILRRS